VRWRVWQLRESVVAAFLVEPWRLEGHRVEEGHRTRSLQSHRLGLPQEPGDKLPVITANRKGEWFVVPRPRLTFIPFAKGGGEFGGYVGPVGFIKNGRSGHANTLSPCLLQTRNIRNRRNNPLVHPVIPSAVPAMPWQAVVFGWSPVIIALSLFGVAFWLKRPGLAFGDAVIATPFCFLVGGYGFPFGLGGAYGARINFRFGQFAQRQATWRRVWWLSFRSYWWCSAWPTRQQPRAAAVALNDEEVIRKIAIPVLMIDRRTASKN
jgi:hypothetical protein